MQKKIYSLQTMRLFASLMVFQFHMWHNYLNKDFLHPGTDFFIVLVGMVAAIAQSHRIPYENWGKYIWARYLRLYVTFIPIFALYVLSGRDSLNLEFFFKSFFFIPIYDSLPLVGPTWMLSMFLVFYWLFTLAFIFHREGVLIPVFALWTAGILAYSWFNWNSSLPDEWNNILFNHRNIEFIFGYLGGKLLLTRQVGLKTGGRILALGLGSITIGVILLNNEVFSLAWRTYLFGIPLTMVSIGLSALEQNNSTNRLFQVFTHPWLVWLGGTSYVLYLIHNMVLRIWDTIIPITPIQTPLITIITVLIGAIGYKLWEKPVLKYIKTKTLQRIFAPY